MNINVVLIMCFFAFFGFCEVYFSVAPLTVLSLSLLRQIHPLGSAGDGRIDLRLH